MKIGICADNYKVPLFEQELTAAGFTFTKLPLTVESTSIFVQCEEKQLGRLKTLVMRVNSEATRKKTDEN